MHLEINSAFKDNKTRRCLHGLLNNTCSLCKGWKQTDRPRTGFPIGWQTESQFWTFRHIQGTRGIEIWKTMIINEERAKTEMKLDQKRKRTLLNSVVSNQLL